MHHITARSRHSGLMTFVGMKLGNVCILNFVNSNLPVYFSDLFVCTAHILMYSTRQGYNIRPYPSGSQ